MLTVEVSPKRRRRLLDPPRCVPDERDGRDELEPAIERAGISPLMRDIAAVRAIDDIEHAAVGAKFLDDLMTHSEASKLRKADPDTFKEFVEEHTQDTPVRNVYVPIEAINEYMQSEGYEEGSLDAYRDQIEEAQATNGDVVIPIADAAADLAGTKTWEALRESARLQPGGISQKEALAKHDEIMAGLEQQGKELGQEIANDTATAEERFTVEQDVRNTLLAAGRTTQQAAAEAKIIAARYATRAADLTASGTATTPMEAWQAAKVSVINRVTGAGKQAAGREVAQPAATVNIGLDVNDGSKLTLKEVRAALKAAGVKVQQSKTHQSDTEKTLVAQLDRALTPEEAAQLSATLRQDAIAQHTPEGGALFGPQAEAWGPFNPKFFLTLEGSRLQDREFDQSATVGGYEGLAPYLTDEERDGLREASKAKILAIAESLPDAEEMAAVALAGRAKRGWYENSAQAILDVFGVADAPRFAALLAALSPQTSVQSNLYNALKTWTNWNNAGRPTDRKAIVQIMGQSVEGNKGIASILNSWINNSVLALTAAEPGQVKLSGPKVDSFMSNLVGVVDEVTQDTWMASFMGADPTKLRGGKKSAFKGVSYKAMNAVVRKAADILSEKTGELWTPAEVQETIWSFAKTLYEKRDAAGENRTARALLEAGGVTHDDIANTPDFAVLFADGIYKTILEEGGYGDRTQSLGSNRRAVGVDGEASVAERPEASGFSEADYQRFLGQAADRLEQVRERRRGAADARPPQPRQPVRGSDRDRGAGPGRGRAGAARVRVPAAAAPAAGARRARRPDLGQRFDQHHPARQPGSARGPPRTPDRAARRRPRPRRGLERLRRRHAHRRA